MQRKNNDHTFNGQTARCVNYISIKVQKLEVEEEEGREGGREEGKEEGRGLPAGDQN